MIRFLDYSNRSNIDIWRILNKNYPKSMVWSMAKVYVISRLYSFYFNAAMSLKNMTDVIANKYSDNEYFYAWND